LRGNGNLEITPALGRQRRRNKKKMLDVRCWMLDFVSQHPASTAIKKRFFRFQPAKQATA